MLFTIAWLTAAFPVAALAADISREPLPVMQQNPAMLRHYDPQPTSAQILGAGGMRIRLDQYYSSIFLADRPPNPDRFLVDMELYVAEIGLRYGIGGKSDLEIRVPVVRPLAGVLDPFLRGYHRVLGLPNGGREFRPDNAYAYRYRGETGGWMSRPQWELGNVRLKLRRQVLREVLAVMAGIQFPSASRGRGWTNGGADVGLGAVGSWQGGAWFGHLEAWWLHPFARADVGTLVRDYLRAAATLGRRVAPFSIPLHLIVQVQGGSSPYRTGVAALDAHPWLIGFGLRAASGRNLQWSLAFTENITQKSTQDFGISLGLEFAPAAAVP